ncbi:FIST signal transduction protein [Ferrovibrio xuzhouensis]|uniref:FIST C-terminal domain-containing protein n=1 Tax=Ferrovibrio xuzhouensis TaxID=1576914 RepID=A0ABV7VJL9_9PROT
MTEQTAGSRFRLGVSAAEDWRMAVDGCLLQLMPLSDAANIGFVYVSDRLADRLPKIVRRLSAATGIEMIVGACAYSVAAGDTEFCDEPVVACLIGEVPDDSATLFSSPTERPQGWFGVVHADPQVPALPELIEDFSEASGAYLVGGLIAGRGARPQWAGKVAEGSMSGVVFSEAQPVLTGMSQGCAQVGDLHTVTAADGNLVLELDDRPAYDVLRDSFGVESLQDLRKLGTGLMIGLPVSGTDRPDYLVRNIIGVDPQAGGIAIGAMVEEGDSLFFCRRDVESAGRDMDRMLADLKRRCGDQTPRGALWFSCMARCQDQFVQTPGELSRIQTVFPDLPLVGMYCGGEIAQSRLYGYTGVLALFL